MKITKLFFAIIIAAFLNSCANEDFEPQIPKPSGKYESGAFVLNEGTGGNSSVSFISNDLNTFENDAFGAVNPAAILGNTPQSICFNGDLAYIVVNGANKIQIVNRNTMLKVGEITAGLSNPRYMVIANGQGYVTNWGTVTFSTPQVPEVTPDDFVAVINLTTNTVSSTIPVVEGPERIVANGNNLYVAQKGGYYFGNSITVINSTTLAKTTISTGDLPTSMLISNGSLWVLCKGNPNYAPIETAGKLQKISLTTNAIIETFNFSSATIHPENLELFNNKFYYTIDSGIYRMNLTPAASIALPTTPIFSTPIQNVYGFAVKSDRIYVSGYNSFIDPGKIEVFSAGELNDPPTGTLLKSFTVGIGPNGFYFNQ